MQIKRMIKGVIGCCLAIIMAFPTYAYNEDWTRNLDVQEMPMIATVSTQEESAVVSAAAPRSMLISMCSLQISNEGKGVIGAYADTLCHYPMNRIRMRIYLDAIQPGTVGGDEDWYTYDYYDYDWLASDYPDDELTMVSVSFDINGMPRGTEYRLRCIHLVYDSNSSLQESMSTRTAWIPLD